MSDHINYISAHNEETELYRHFDSSGRLLYVGISLSTPQRLQQHMRGSKWAAEIERVEIERFPSRRDAIGAEIKAIISEKPLWNVAHNQPKTGKPKAHKKPNPKPAPKPFNAKSVAQNIQTVAIWIEDISRLIKVATSDGPPSMARTIGLNFELNGKYNDEELGLSRIFEVAFCETGVSAAFRIICGISALSAEEETDKAYISILTPKGLKNCLEERLGKNNQYDEIYQSSIVPAVSKFERAFKAMNPMVEEAAA